MKNKIFPIIAAGVAGLICLPLSASAAEKKKAATSPKPEASAAPAASPAKAAPHPLPFQGTVSAVDQTAKTFSIGKTSSSVFKVTGQTEITKAGQPATMADITENVKVTGWYRKQEDGALEVKMVKIGAVGEKKETGKKKEPSESPAASPKP